MFHIGQKVVCIEAPRGILEKDGIYTIDSICVIDSILGLRFIDAPDWSFFIAKYFRPLTSRDTKISFTEGAPKDSERWDGRRKQEVSA